MIPSDMTTTIREYPDIVLEPNGEGWNVYQVAEPGRRYLGHVVAVPGSLSRDAWRAVTADNEEFSARTRREAIGTLKDSITLLSLAEAAELTPYTASNLYRCGVKLWLADPDDDHGLPATWAGTMWKVRVVDVKAWMSKERTVGRRRQYGAA